MIIHVTKRELNPKNHALTKELEENLERLYVAVNCLRTLSGMPFQIPSGLRSKKEQEHINPKHMGSAHLLGLACDIYDPDGKIWDWCISNIPTLEKLSIYLEDRKATPTWVHVQLLAPRSGKRIFLP